MKYIYLFKKDLDFIVSILNGHINKLKNSNLFLTGGTGIIGKWLIETLCFLNEKFNLKMNIYVLTRDKNKFLNSYPLFKYFNDIIFLEGNITDIKLSPDLRPDYIIHGATESTFNLTGNPLYMSRVIIKGTFNILDFSIKVKPKGILFLTSGAVYGKHCKNFFVEEHLGKINFLEPYSAYAFGKQIMEHLAELYFYTYNLPIKIARIFSLVGPHLPLSSHFAIGNFIRDAIKGGPIFIKGDGRPIRSYLYLRDLTIWLLIILFEGKNGLPYNVGSEEAISIKELATLIAHSIKEKEIDIIIEKKQTFSSAGDVYVPSIKRAKKLGLKVYTSLEESINKTIAFYSSCDNYPIK
jgi:dTDP-glucose 4,6-dehydratase